MTKKSKTPAARSFEKTPKPTSPNVKTPGFVPVQKQEAVAPAAAKRRIESRPLPGKVTKLPPRRRNPKESVGKALESKIKSLAPGFASNTVAGAGDIAELARSLKNDVDLIWQFVHDNIEFIPTFGSQKGAWGCLIDGMGNSFDISDLMIQLLTEAGYTASYMYGELQLTESEVADWLGTDVSDIYAASNLLAVGGVPNSVIWTGSAYLIEISHCWVRCTIGVTNYHFDAAIKDYDVISGIDIGTAISYNRTSFMSDATSGATITSDYVQDINRTNIRDNLDTLTTNLVNYIKTNNVAASTDDILGGRKIVPTSTTPLRQTSHPKLKPMTSPTVWGSIPNGYKATLNVAYDTIDETFYSADIHGRRMSLFFNGSHEAELRVDGSLIATSSAQTPSSWNSVWLEVVHPYPTSFADEGHWQTVLEGGYYLICQAWGNAGRGMIEYHRSRQAIAEFNGGSSTDEDVLGSSLAVFFHTWNTEKSWACDVLNRMTNCTTVLHHQTGLVAHFDTALMDLGGIIWASGALDNDWNNVDTNDTALAMHGIAFEAGAIEQNTGVKGVSSTTILDHASAQGLKIYDADSGNWTGTVRPALTNYSTQQKDDIENWWVNWGWRVAVPEDGALSIDSFTGMGYYAISPWYGAIGIYNGGLKGSMGSNYTSTGGMVGKTCYVGIDASQVNTGVFAACPDGTTQVITYIASDVNAQGPAGIAIYKNGLSSEPVALVNGQYLYDHVDLTLGSMAFPYGLSFQRFYQSGRRYVDSVLGLGWTHNHAMTCMKNRDAFAGMAHRNPLHGAAGIVAMFVNVDLYRDLAKPMDKWVTIAHTNRWMLDAFIDNTVIVNSCDGSQMFFKLPDGTFLPPMGSAAELTDNGGGSYTLLTGQKVEYNFNTDGKISTIVFPFGVTITYAYSMGLLSTVTNGMGRTLTFTHSTGKLTSVSDGTGRSVNFTRDVDGNLTEVEDPDGKSTTYSYVSEGLMESIFKPANPMDPIVINTYDSLGRVMEQEDAYTNVTEFFIAGPRSEEKDALGNSKVVYFRGDGLVTKSIDQLGNERTFEYDGIGRLVLATAPEGNSTEYEYDEFHNVVTVTAHAKPGSGLSDIVNTFTYDLTWNKVDTATNNLGRTTTNTYDNTTGQLLKVEQPVIGMLTPTTTFTYTVRGQIETVEDPTGVITEFTYDSTTEKLEQVVRDVGNLDLTTIYDHNSRGDVISITDPNSNETTIDYDPLRRVIQVVAPSPFSYVTNYTYDENGNRLTVERETGDVMNPWQINTATYFIDDLLESVIDPSSQATNFLYTDLRQLWKTTDAESRVVERSYDAVGRLATVIDPDSNNSSTRTYTDNGLVETIEDASSNVTQYEFDGFDRLKKKIYPDSTFEEMIYNVGSLVETVTTRNGDDINMTYDVLNRLATKSPDLMPVQTYVYDLAGRLQTLSTPVVLNHPESGTFTVSYDTAGRRISEQYPDGKTVSHTLDANGNAIRMDYPGSYYIERVFDELNRLTDIKLNGSGSAALHFDYDPLSRRTGLTYENGTSVSYGHQLNNDLDQLVQTFVGSSVTFGYDFNAIHQLTGQSISDDQFMWHPASGGTIAYGTANNMNQYPTVGGLTQVHNPNGCLTDNGVWDFGYDTFNQLISATDGVTSVAYLYDPTGRQLQKNVGGTKSNYLYAGMQRIADYDGSNTLLQRYVYGAGLDEPLIKITSGGTKTYMHHDRMGNVIGITNSSGAVINRFKYSPWGESPNMSGTTFGFQGQRYDSDTGLYYMKLRYYDSKTGRFLQPDPIGYCDGLNIYQFADNNPNNFTDPLGLAADGSVLHSDIGSLVGGMGSLNGGLLGGGGAIIPASEGGNSFVGYVGTGRPSFLRPPTRQHTAHPDNPSNDGLKHIDPFYDTIDFGGAVIIEPSAPAYTSELAAMRAFQDIVRGMQANSRALAAVEVTTFIVRYKWEWNTYNKWGQLLSHEERYYYGFTAGRAWYHNGSSPYLYLNDDITVNGTILAALHLHPKAQPLKSGTAEAPDWFDDADHELNENAWSENKPPLFMGSPNGGIYSDADH